MLIRLYSLLHRQKPTGNTFGEDGFRSLYYNAMKAGYRRKQCNRLYPSCPFNSQQIMTLVRSMGRDLIQDPLNFIASTPGQNPLQPEESESLSSLSQRKNNAYANTKRRSNKQSLQKFYQSSFIKKVIPSKYTNKKQLTKIPKYEHIGYRKS